MCFKKEKSGYYTLILIVGLILFTKISEAQEPIVNLGSYNSVDWNTLNSSGYMSLHPANDPGNSQNLPSSGNTYYNFLNWNNGLFQTQLTFVNGPFGKVFYRTRYTPSAWTDGYNNWGQLVSTENTNGDVGIEGKLKIGSNVSPQTLNIFGGIGFTNQNANDKKLYSPVDGLLEWMTHNSAGEHGFAISHQGFKTVYLNTSGNSYFNGGNIGIGTTTPISLLDVRGRLTVPEISFALNGTDDSDPYRLRKVQSSSNVNWLELQLNDDYNESFRIYGNSCEGFNCLEYSGNLYHSFDASGNVYHKGNVGIGTVTPDEKLTVKGKIHAEEVRVDLNVPGPDYVFEQDYQLKSLPAIQAFIKENKHLPEVPSAKEMEEKGINLSEMNMLLLKKVEELTLHLIKQDEYLKASQHQQEDILKQLAILMKRNEDLEKQINQFIKYD
jgi:hypothetical protein